MIIKLEILILQIIFNKINFKISDFLSKKLVMLFIIINLSEPLKILNIVDYIYSDYENAINDSFEYKEMLEFSKNLIELSDSSILSYSKNVYDLIKNKENPEKVKYELSRIREIILNKANLDIYPKNPISLKSGREIYLYNCAVCHGDKGDGNGPASKTLNPKPANFLERYDLSPLRIWTILNVGLVNMPSFNNLSDDEKWNVAFYVLSIKYQNAQKKKVNNKFDLKSISKFSDENLKKMGYKDDEIAYIRTNIENLIEKKDHFYEIFSSLDLIRSLYQKGEYEKAYRLSVDLYFNDFEPIEKNLFAKDFSFASKLEQKFTQLRGIVKQKNKEKELENLILNIKNDLEKARVILEGKAFSGNWAFFNSFTIIFREGLEVAILFGIILSIVKLSENNLAIIISYLGLISAILLGIITWILSQFIISISTLQREMLEGIVSILAAIVLFQVSYWLISKSESKIWIGYIKEKLKSSLNKSNLFFIFSLSFLAGYREAFETVLFYQAMIINTSKTDLNYIIFGFLIGLITIIIIGYLILKFQLKLPLNLIFPITGSILYILSFIFTGQAIRSFQEANLISTTPLDFLPTMDFLGIYPTLETALAQSIFIILVILAIIIIKKEKKKREKLLSEIEIAEREILNIIKSITDAKDRICKYQNLIVNVVEVSDKLKNALLHIQNLETALKEIQNDITLKRKNGQIN